MNKVEYLFGFGTEGVEKVFADALFAVIVLAIVAVTRMMSLGSLVASLSYPVLFWIYLPEGANRLMFMSFAVAAMLLSIFCHRSNIARLVHRRENKLNFGRITHISKEYMRKHREKRAKK